MKGLIIVCLGILIWGISLVWPEINRGLTPFNMSVSALGMLAGYAFYLKWKQGQSRASSGRRKSPPAFRPPSTGSRPIRPVGMA